MAVLTLLLLGCRVASGAGSDIAVPAAQDTALPTAQHLADPMGCASDTLSAHQKINRLQLPADAPFQVVAAQPSFFSCSLVEEVPTPSRIQVLAMIDDRRFVVRDLARDSIGVFDLDAPDELTELFAYNGQYDAAAMLPDGRIAAIAEGRDIAFADVDGAEAVVMADSKNSTYDLAVVDDGRVAVLGRHHIRLVDPSGQLEPELLYEQGQGTNLLALRDGRLFSWSKDGEVEILDPAGELPAAEFEIEGRVGQLIELSDGRIAGVVDDAQVWVWDLGTPTDPVEITRDVDLTEGTPVADEIASLAELDDGRLVVVGLDFAVNILDLATRERVVLGHHAQPDWAGVRGDGLVVTASTNQVRIWDPTVESRMAVGHAKSIVAVAGLADGGVATVGADGNLFVWESVGTRGPTVVSDLVVERDTRSVIELTGGQLVTNRLGSMTLWDLDASESRPFSDHELVAIALATSDGRVVAQSARGIEILDGDGSLHAQVSAPDDRWNLLAQLQDGKLVLFKLARVDGEFTGNTIVSTWDPDSEQLETVAETDSAVVRLADDVLFFRRSDGTIQQLVPGQAMSETDLRPPESSWFVPVSDTETIGWGTGDLVVTGESEWRHPLSGVGLLEYLGDGELFVQLGSGWFIAKVD